MKPKKWSVTVQWIIIAIMIVISLLPLYLAVITALMIFMCERLNKKSGT